MCALLYNTRQCVINHQFAYIHVTLHQNLATNWRVYMVAKFDQISTIKHVITRCIYTYAYYNQKKTDTVTLLHHFHFSPLSNCVHMNRSLLFFHFFLCFVRAFFVHRTCPCLLLLLLSIGLIIYINIIIWRCQSLSATKRIKSVISSY